MITLTNKVIATAVRKASLDGLPVVLWDKDVRGFGARISPTGRVTWRANKSIGKGKGANHRVVVGHFPGMSLDAARIEAGLTLARLAKGEDVQSQSKKARRDKVEGRQCPTIKTAVGDYLTARKHDPKRDMQSRYEIELRQLFERQVVPELGASKRVNAVTKADVKALLKTRIDRGSYVAARYLCVVLRPFFDWWKS